MSEIVRRDPRSEWIARNRLHPEHDAVLARMGGGAKPAQWMGPNGVIRRNPHAVGFIGPNGIRRIDRSGAQNASAAGAARREAAAAPARRRVQIDSPAFCVAVVADMPGGRLSAHDRDVLGLARQLADADGAGEGAVLLVTFGEPREEGLGDAGVDRVVNFAGARFEGYAPELKLTALGGVERQHEPRHWLFPDSPLGGAELGRRLAVRLGERPATQVWQIADGQCTGRGAAGATDVTRNLPRIVLALPECAEPVSDTVHAAEALAPPAALPQVLRRVDDLGAVAVDPAGVALAEAEFILSAGNGIRDWDGFHHAARVLGATEGASRVAVDNGFMPRHRQVGATGTWVTARVYLAAGISGAIQHLQGIQQCDKVVAINTDPGCDMVKRADLAVIADSGEVLAALVELVEGVRKEQRNAA
jgi:electron transfer flavoprotein alpha subunit